MEKIILDLPATLRSLLRQIPVGQVATYGGLADALGDRSAARWVGEYLVNHPHDEDCPCHRVVRSNGEIGLFVSGCPEEKRRALMQESIRVHKGRVELENYRFEEFVTDHPLKRLVEWQRKIAEQTRLVTHRNLPQVVAGVDVSYSRTGNAVGAYCLVDASTGKCLWSKVISQITTFPYIPGLLVFRELPVLLALLDAAEQQGRIPGLLFVDGNGILHPRRAGIATCLGVLTGLRTIGVGKSLLCGRIHAEPCSIGKLGKIIHSGHVVGMAVRGAARFRPVYVSPGNGIDVQSAATMASRVFYGHRLPEPLFLADALSRAHAQST